MKKRLNNIKKPENKDVEITQIADNYISRVVKKGFEKAKKGNFGTRILLNEERVANLLKDVDFKNDLLPFEKKFKLTNLNPNEDLVDYTVYKGDKDVTISASNCFNNLDKRQQKLFRNDIYKIIEKYGLQTDFYEWLEYYILYGEVPPWKPLANFDLFYDLLNNPLTEKMALKYGITIYEKNYVRKIFREHLGIKNGRPNKKYKTTYKRFCNYLKLFKNKNRRLKNLKLSEEVINFKGGIDKYYEPTKNRDVIKIIGIRSLAGEVLNDNSNKATNRLRKHKQRLKNRTHFLMNKEK